MIQEDLTAAKLRGHNCLIKFKDNEELTLYVESLEKDGGVYVLTAMEQFINAGETKLFPVDNIALCHDTVKYILKI